MEIQINNQEDMELTYADAVMKHRETAPQRTKNEIARLRMKLEELKTERRISDNTQESLHFRSCMLAHLHRVRNPASLLMVDDLVAQIECRHLQIKASMILSTRRASGTNSRSSSMVGASRSSTGDCPRTGQQLTRIPILTYHT
jgi:hypothetical protein